MSLGIVSLRLLFVQVYILRETLLEKEISPFPHISTKVSPDFDLIISQVVLPSDLWVSELLWGQATASLLKEYSIEMPLRKVGYLINLIVQGRARFCFHGVQEIKGSSGLVRKRSRAALLLKYRPCKMKISQLLQQLEMSVPHSLLKAQSTPGARPKYGSYYHIAREAYWDRPLRRLPKLERTYLLQRIQCCRP